MKSPTPTREIRATLSIKSTKITLNPDNSINEDTSLIHYFQKLIGEAAQPLKGLCEFGEIRIVPGRYIVDIYSKPGMDTIPLVLRDLLDNLEFCKIKLEENALRKTPKTAEACGVDTQTIKIFQALNSEHFNDNPIMFESPEIPLQAFPITSPEALMALPIHKERKAKKVDGEVTSLSRDGDDGCSIQVSGDNTWISVKVPLDEAWRWVSSRKKITGRAQWDGSAFSLDPYEIEESQLFSDFET